MANSLDNAVLHFWTSARRLVGRVLRRLRRAEEQVGSGEISVDQMIALAFPFPLTPEAREAIVAAAGSAVVDDLPTLRRMLGALDRNIYPSFVYSRLGDEDVVEVVVNGVKIHVDAADPSISQTLIQHGYYEPYISTAFERYVTAGNTVLDIGANIGVHSVLAGKLVGPNGRVIAVEPYSENCRLILRSFRANGFTNLELFPIAADDQPGWTYFGVSIGSNAGLFDETDGELVDRRSLVVPRFALDSIVTGKVDFIKIDIEGAEPRAIRGLTVTIERDRPVIVTEFCPAMLWGMSKTTPEEYLGWFVDRGYEIRLIDRATGNEIGLGSPAEIARSWGDDRRIEDLVLTPGGA